ARLMERARHEDHESQALQLADGYLRDDTSPGDDDMLSRVAREDVGGDLEVRYWRDGSQLEEQLAASMRKHLALTDDKRHTCPSMPAWACPKTRTPSRKWPSVGKSSAPFAITSSEPPRSIARSRPSIEA